MDTQHSKDSREIEKEIDLIFKGLRSKNREEQTRHALTLKNSLFGGGSGIGQINNELSDSVIFNRLHEITVSKDTELKIDTFYSLKAFIELVCGPELETSRIARVLDSMINIPQISREVADTLGSLYKPGWSLTATSFKFTVETALTNFTNNLDQKKLSGILLLQSLTNHNPGALYPFIVKTILERLSITLKDPNLNIRRESANLLEKCLVILYHRDNYISTKRFNQLYDEATENLRSSSTESIHSAFLLFKTLLRIVILSNNNRSLSTLNNQNNADAISFGLLTDKVDEVYSKSWLFKDYKSSTIRCEIIEIIPLIAKFNNKIFTLKYLQSIIEFYINRLKKDKDRIPILYLFGSISLEIGNTNCLIYAKSLVGIVESLLITLSNGNNSLFNVSKTITNAPTNGNAVTSPTTTGTITNIAMDKITETLNKTNLNTFSSFNPGTQIFAGPFNHSLPNAVFTNGSKKKDANGDFFVYSNPGNRIEQNVNETVSFQNISEYKGLKRYELEKAVFFVIKKLCQTLGSKITQVLTLNLIELIIGSCNLTRHLTHLLSKLIDYYPNLESFILQKILNQVTHLLGGTDFIEPGVSIASLNLNNKDKKKLLQKSVIGVHIDESKGRVFLNNGYFGSNNSHEINGSSNLENGSSQLLHDGGGYSTLSNGSSTSLSQEITGNESRAAELRKKIALYKQPYSTSTAPLSNYNIRDLSSGFSNFTAAHEVHSVANHTHPNKKFYHHHDKVGTHFITIKDLIDLNRAKKLRNNILKDYEFISSGILSNGAGSHAGGVITAALNKLTGLSDDYFKRFDQLSNFEKNYYEDDNDTDIIYPISNNSIDSYEYQEIALLIECFQILKKFNFAKYVSLFEFSRYVILTYIDHQDIQVKKLAAQITSKLFDEDEIINSIQIGSITAVSDVLAKLLLLAVSDPNSEIRLTVLECLVSKYDPQLAQSDNVKLLLICLNDADFEVRKASISILGRISIKNPAYVIPALRKVLLQYLNNLKYGAGNAIKETSCSLLTCLVSSAEMLTKPHISAIMDTIVPLLRDSKKNSVISSLATKCVGEIARVSGESSKEFLDDVIPLIMGILKDNAVLISKEEKIIAIRSLSQLIRSSGDVVTPYFLYPDMLAEIIKIISDNNVDPELKKETIKLQGILGALDPYKARTLESHYKSIRQNSDTSLIINTSIRDSLKFDVNNKSNNNNIVIKTEELLNDERKPKDDKDFSNASEIAKNWGHDDLGKHFEQGVDLNEMLNITDASMRIPKLIQMETPTDLLLLMQLNNELRPLHGGEDYYLIVVLNMLIRLLKDQSASSHHEPALNIIVTIFDQITEKCLGYAKLIISGMLNSLKNFNAVKMRLAYQNIDKIVRLIGKFVRPAVPEILESIKASFKLTDRLMLIGLIETVSMNLDNEFKLYLPIILSTLLETLNDDLSVGKLFARKVINAFVTFGVSIEEYSNLIVINILKFIQPNGGPNELRKTAIEAIMHFTRYINLTDMSSNIIHSFLSILKSSNPYDIQLRDTVMRSLRALIVQLKNDYFIFLPAVDTVLNDINYTSVEYTSIVHKLIKNENPTFQYPPEDNLVPSHKHDVNMKPVDGNSLQEYWECYSCKTKGDWIEWLKTLGNALLKYSPSISLSSCQRLAYSYSPVARELFNSAFAAIWVAIGDEFREELGKSLLYGLQNATNCPDVLQTILNLAEFMEHNNTPLPMNLTVLSKYSFRHHAFAKSLHYKEIEFKDSSQNNTVSITTIDSLININNSLQQSDSGDGMLKIATDFYKFEAKESWYQKLSKWNEALKIYENKWNDNQINIEVINGKMSCMHALGQWDNLEDFTEKNWNSLSQTNREKVAPLAAAAAWGTNKWEKMDEYIENMKQDSANKYFFDAILNVHRCNYESAEKNIKSARELLSGEITSLINESYSRAYDVVVRIQMLSDLEEIIEYKELDENSPRKLLLRKAWDKRLFYCQSNVDIWQRLLNIRSLVITPKNDLSARIKFANLCRKSGRIALAEQTLSELKGNAIHFKSVPGNDNYGGSFTHPKLVYSQLKLLWEQGIEQKDKAWRTLYTFTADLSASLCLKSGKELVSSEVPKILPCDSEEEYFELRRILCKCYLMQGKWYMTRFPNWVGSKENEEGVLGSFLIPTILYDDWYKGWHYWALANYEVISSKSKMLRTREDKPTPAMDDPDNENELVKLHAIPAIKGFFTSIKLANSIALQDLLRLLGLWFAYGGYKIASKEIENGVSTLPIEYWLQVLPQLFSRLHHPDVTINNTLTKLLTRLAEMHPQALLFPLNVSSRSDKKTGQKAAEKILKTVGNIHSKLVAESTIVVHGLIQVALLLSERWFHGIEDAVSIFQTGHNLSKIPKIFDELMAEKKSTFHEQTFWAIWGPDLTRGYEWITKYKKTLIETGINDSSLLQSAFDVFASIHNKLSGEFNNVKFHFLEFVSPNLLKSKNLKLAVPGTFVPGRTVIGIGKFENKVPVISSKQRPRRFFIYGIDGRLYDYVLKGLEDIRQDNMVMQLFGLVNKLLDNDPECFARHLSLEPYPTIPLSPKSGLLGWVPNSDTFHTLILQNRQFKGISKEIERRAFSTYAGKTFDFATALRRLELFIVSLNASKGMDIYDVLWLKSRSSEIWLERRTTYIRSLGLTSIVGYILGLGDRHPSNIMIHRVSGKVIHIDYGDCFESASLREKWPEQVPFRLTRMMVNALEASGIEGSFRITLDNVVRVVRSNKESLLALFDSFATDPLIKWGFDIPNKAVMRETGYKPKYIDPALAKENEKEYNKLISEEEKLLLDARAQYVLRRITEKLTGNDFKRFKNLEISDQVDKLIKQATNKEGLALHFLGWCAFW